MKYLSFFWNPFLGAFLLDYPELSDVLNLNTNRISRQLKTIVNSKIRMLYFPPAEYGRPNPMLGTINKLYFAICVCVCRVYVFICTYIGH